MRARPDILTAVSFLCTRVSKPDVDDRYKLRRVLQYLRSTPKLHLTLECENLTDLCWHIDASYAVHQDLKSHSGGVFLMGRGAVLSGSTKQKINTKSSTEAELVGVDDFMGVCYRLDTSSRHKDTMSVPLPYIRTIRVRYYWKRMGQPWVQKEQNTSMWDISLSLTESIKGKSPLITARQTRWLLTSLLSLCRADYFNRWGHGYSIWGMMMSYRHRRQQQQHQWHKTTSHRNINRPWCYLIGLQECVTDRRTDAGASSHAEE